MSTPSVVALLPMKGLSERVPQKNIRQFAGFPLFYHILETLCSVDEISSVIINTDSEQIKSLAQDFPKVCFHDRPEQIRGGHIPMNTIIDYDISLSKSFYFLQTHSTNPLLTAKTIRRAIKIFFKKIDEYDSLFSVNKIQQRLYDKNFLPINHDPAVLKNTQDLDPIYDENSCIYIFSRQSFLENNKNRIGKKPYAFVMPQIESYDIDTEDDFKIAEHIFLALHRRRNG